MFRRWLVLPLFVALAGCSDPLAGPERLSETADIPLDGAPNAVPTEEGLTNETPVLAGLFRGARNEPAPEDADATGKAGGTPGPVRVARDGLYARDVALGTVLPFGQIARVCDAKGKTLGKRVEQAARRGARYRLYDSVPNSAAPRTFYVKGFKDNCPRQFTAALAMFGTPELHEQLRYGLPAKEYPYSMTDKAYEVIKSQVCGVARTKPCGPRISRLEQTTVFVSAYENFTENPRWADMLLHEGSVLAVSVKTP